MKVLLAGVSIVALAFATAATAPSEAAAGAEVDGFFIEQGADATADVVGRAVSDARSAGSRFYAVVLADEPASGATTYSDAVLDDLPDQEGTVLVVAPETVGWASQDDVWTTDELNDALDASLDGTTSNDVVVIFVDSLVNPSSSGGSGLWIFLLVVLAIAAVIAFFVWRSSRSSKARAAETLAEVKAEAQQRIDALANDILDDEAEVSEADNDEASGHFDEAARIYGTADDRLRAARNEREVLAVVIDVDTAIWHLDCAEAILDGEDLPPKPEPPKPPEPEPAPAPQPTSPPRTTPGGTGYAPEPLPQYRRRSQRRSSFGADDMLKTILAAQAVRSLSGGRRSSRSSSSSRSSGRTSSRSGSSRRSRGGGRRRG